MRRAMRVPGAVILLLVALQLTRAAALGAFRGSARPPCEGPEADPWVTELRNRVLSGDRLAAYAVERYGPPRRCEGAVTAEFDGAKFGSVRLDFADGVTFTVETQPPEASIVVLRAISGLGAAAAVRRVLEAYSAGLGLRIDWTVPAESRDGDERVQSFWDPEPGVNGSASLIFLGDTLVAVRVSMAP